MHRGSGLRAQPLHETRCTLREENTHFAMDVVMGGGRPWRIAPSRPGAL